MSRTVRRRSSSGVSWPPRKFGGAMWVGCGCCHSAKQHEMAEQTYAGEYVRRSAMMYCHPRLRQRPAPPCSQRLSVSRASWGSTPDWASRAAPGCCRLLQATPVCPGISGRPPAIPGYWPFPARGSSRLPALPGPWGTRQQRCRRLRLLPWLLPAWLLPLFL